ncbi:MAG: DUF1611 domain-containing protein [Fimbriimonadaceae bacterium]|nr:DUF1611 domain-containing protein [Fimbriimonadaceae bacterium]
MLQRHQPLAIYMEGALDVDIGKMGFGILRYSPNPVACVIDSRFSGRDQQDITRIPRSCPVVGSVAEAISKGAEVLVLGTAPPGGLIPQAWNSAIQEAINGGLSIVNGLHDLLAPRFPNLKPGQWVWDVRLEPKDLGVNEGRARLLPNKRVLMIGTSMAVGKMTAGLEIYRTALSRGIKAEFVATGQIGITIMGSGVPLDAVRVDYAAGAIEREVMCVAEAELIIVEGQGALIHPGSTATLPLLRGSMPTHLILCHIAGMDMLNRVSWVKVPPLRDYVRLYEDLAEACGTFPRPKTAGICVNTFGLDEAAAREVIQRTQDETGLHVTDPVRFGVDGLLEALG